MSQQEINYAFAIGALEKMAEYDVSPAKFVEAATQSNHQGMRKIATAVVELDCAVQREKQAWAGGRSSATAIADGVGNLAGRIPMVGKRIEEGLGHTAVRNAADSANSSVEELAGFNKLLAGRGKNTLNAAYDPVSRKKVDALMDAISKRNANVAGAGAAAGGLGALGLAGGAAYGAGDADTYGNQARGLANDNLGTDFDMQSRLAELLGR